MAIQKVNLDRFANMTSDSPLEATDWNTIMSTINLVLNGCVDVCNQVGSGVSAGKFYVNGAETEPVDGVVALDSKGTYVLEGILEGRVVIGTPSDTWGADEDAPTSVILNGVTIIDSSEDNSALEYVPEFDKCLVTLTKNKANHLVCNNVAERTDGQKGALHCANNMTIQGSGYLSCINQGGHGVKASELKLYGNPHIYCEAIHDGIHGSKLIIIGGGKFYVNGANDAFGTRKESGEPGTGTYKAAGHIDIFGGEFWAYNLEGNIFDSEGVIYVQNEVMNTKAGVVNTQATGLLVHTDVPEASQYNGTVNLNPETVFGSPSVTGATLADGVYTATQAEVTISGYFKDCKFVFPIKSSTLRLEGAYIETSTGHAVGYTVSEKNIKISVASGTVNIIKVTGEGNYCISSENNIAFEPKGTSTLMLSSESGIAVSGSEVSVRDGYGLVCTDGGIMGSQIIISDAASTFGGCLKSGSVIARLSGKGQKGNISVIRDTLIGCIDTGSLESAGLSDLAWSTQVFYREQSGSSFMGDPGKTIEPYDVIPYGKSDVLLQSVL